MPDDVPPEMTAADAVEALNRFRHHGHANWWFDGHFVKGDDYYEHFECDFDAIAVVEKLQRLAGSPPEGVKFRVEVSNEPITRGA